MVFGRIYLDGWVFRVLRFVFCDGVFNKKFYFYVINVYLYKWIVILNVIFFVRKNWNNKF